MSQENILCKYDKIGIIVGVGKYGVCLQRSLIFIDYELLPVWFKVLHNLNKSCVFKLGRFDSKTVSFKVINCWNTLHAM